MPNRCYVCTLNLIVDFIWEYVCVFSHLMQNSKGRIRELIISVKVKLRSLLLKGAFVERHLEKPITASDIYTYMKSVSAAVLEDDISKIFQLKEDIQLKVFMHF